MRCRSACSQSFLDHSRMSGEEGSTGGVYGVTPSESTLCKFQRFPPNPHRNDSKVPTRHLCAGGKRSNNITQQSSMGPTEQIYTTTTQRGENEDIQYKDPNHLENDTASDYGQDANGAKSPEE